MTQKDSETEKTPRERVVEALENAYSIAEKGFNDDTWKYGISQHLKDCLESLSSQSVKASTGFNNIVTCLAIKAAFPLVDIRYHQTQIQGQTDRPAGFNFRGISEKSVYPWLRGHGFEGAKSGWQTRTFERPKPYLLDYEENIGDIKEPFLRTFHCIEEGDESAEAALACLIHHQMILRETKSIALSIPKTKDTELIVGLFTRHIYRQYKVKGASRLPVLALYSVYEVLIGQVARYAGMALRPLEAHSAADSQTGAIGDIENWEKGRAWDL